MSKLENFFENISQLVSEADLFETKVGSVGIALKKHDYDSIIKTLFNKWAKLNIYGDYGKNIWTGDIANLEFNSKDSKEVEKVASTLTKDLLKYGFKHKNVNGVEYFYTEKGNPIVNFFTRGYPKTGIFISVTAPKSNFSYSRDVKKVGL